MNLDALQTNTDAARVNTFYIVNPVHDISYLYGFTEAAFNFQGNNFGQGGAGNNRIQVSALEPSGTNHMVRLSLRTLQLNLFVGL